MADTKVTHQAMAKLITHNVVGLSIHERQDILQMIVNSVDDSKIQTKGDGTLIKYRDIPLSTISMIYTYIQNKLTAKINALQYFPESDS